MSEGERRLAAIMFTDMVGYTALGQRDESLALSLLEEQRKLLRPIFNRHGGREIKTMGDAFLVEFPSALNAVKCAYQIQRGTREFNNPLPENRRVHIRVGVHVGDVVESRGDISGDAVNIASRIVSVAEDGGVCLTRQVYDHVQNKFGLPLKSLGAKPLKNVRAPIELYRIVMPWEAHNTEEIVELDKRRVAVLPLKNMSPDPNDEYFADGMTEELITALSGVGELTVIARTSVMQYKNSPKRIADVGRELRTGTVIEGSVRKAANKVRITVQMVDARSEGHLWAQNYDRQMDDIFALQSEIAEKVASALKVKLVDSDKRRLERKPTENAEAYTLYLKGRYYWNERTRSSLEKGLMYLRKALEIDPDLALAYSDLADAHVIMADRAIMPPQEASIKSQEYATKALEIDPSLSQPHAALAMINERNFRWTDAEREFKLALELNPNNATARHWYALDLFFRGNRQAAIQEWRKAKDIDPHSLIIGSNLGYALVLAGEKEEGLEMIKAAIDMNDAFLTAHMYLALSYAFLAMKNEAVEEARKIVAMSDDSGPISFAACALARAGQRDEANELLKKLLKSRNTEYNDPAGIAMVYAALNDGPEALTWLEKAVDEKSAQVVYSQVMPWYDFLRADPKFKSMRSRIGLG